MRSLHPASYLKLWDVLDGVVITTLGCQFVGYRLDGIESEAAHEGELVQQATALYDGFKRDIPDHTLVQFIMLAHHDYNDVWAMYDADAPSDAVLKLQRQRRREHLQQLQLRRHDLYVFVGDSRPLTAKEFGVVSAQTHRERASATRTLGEQLSQILRRGGVRCTRLDDDAILRLFYAQLNAAASSFPGVHRHEEVLSDEALTQAPQLRVTTLREQLMHSPLRWSDDALFLGAQAYKVLTLRQLPPETSFTLMEALGRLKMNYRLSVNIRFPAQRRFQQLFERERRFQHATAPMCQGSCRPR